MDYQLVLILCTVWAVLSIIGNWTLFRKAGKPGWHSIIPILSNYDEYDICWSGGLGILYIILLAAVNSLAPSAKESMTTVIAATAATLVIIVLDWKQSMKLARSFGKGSGYGLFLFLFGRVARVILGLSAAEYVGKEE